MIEQFDTETDIASTLGKIGLVAGAGYGLYETGKEAKNILSNSYFRRDLRRKQSNPIKAEERLDEIATKTANAIYNKAPRTRGVFSSLFSTDFSSNWSVTKLKNGIPSTISSGGYKGRSADFNNELSELIKEIRLKGGQISRARLFKYEGVPSSLSFTALGNDFRIPIINDNSEIMLGENRYAVRSTFKQNGTKIINELEGMDVAYIRGIRESLDDIIEGKISTKDLHEKFIQKALWEDSRGGINLAKTKALGDIRRNQAVIDPFEKIKPWKRQNIIKDFSVIHGYSAGSASMQAKGVLQLKDSLLHSGLPGAETSSSIYQLFRENVFENQPRPQVKWTGLNNEKGLAKYNTYVLGDYTYVDANGQTKTVTASESLKSALKELDIPTHELAQEELLVKESIKKAKVSSKMYTYHVDLKEGSTKFTERLVRDIMNEAKKMGIDAAKNLVSGSGIKEVHYNLNNKLNKIIEKQSKVDQNIRELREQREKIREVRKEIAKQGDSISVKRSLAKLKREERRLTDQINKHYRTKEYLKTAEKEYGTLGLKDGRVQQLKIFKNGPQETIDTIRFNSKTGELDIVTKTTRELGEGGKLFGGLKATIDTREIDPAKVAQTIEKQRAALTGRSAIDIGDVDILAMESRVKLKGGVINPSETPIAIMQYTENILQSGTDIEKAKLIDIGIHQLEDGSGYFYKPTGLSAKEIVEKIKSFHPDKTMEDIFHGKSGLGSRITSSIVAPDVHRTQAGIGKKATLSERGIMNIQAMGLDDVVEELMQRRGEAFDPFEQLRAINKMEALAQDGKRSAIKPAAIAEDIEAIFNPDIKQRAELFKKQGWGENIVVDLGEKIGDVQRVPITSNVHWGEFTGLNGEAEALAKQLIKGVNANQSKEELLAISKRYSEAMLQHKETIASRVYKLKKISQSVYGQAASSLEGLDDFAAELGKKMGLKNGELASVSAMTEEDIRRYYNVYDKEGNLTFDAVKKAREKNLWGVLTREPIEGTGSVQFTNIRIAEDFGGSAKETGTIWIAGEDQTKSLARKSLMIDFDKDTVAQFAITKDKSIRQVKNFLGLEGSPNIMGREYLNSLERMSAFDLKGKAPIDLLTMKETELRNALFTEKQLSKAEIGRMSNTFKNIHIGGRESLMRNVTASAAKNFYLAEDFSHLFVENIIKSKHQSKEALVGGQATEILDLLNKESGTEYFRMMDNDRAVAMQSIFDKMSYDNVETASKIRKAGMTGEVSDELMKLMGVSNRDLAVRRAKAYSEITDIENIKNVIELHKKGSKLNAMGDYATKIAEEGLSKKAAFMADFKNMVKMGEELAGKSLWKIGKYGLLPAAAIGLTATLFSKPKKLQPAVDTGMEHEKDVEYNNTEVKIGKTLFSIPENKYDSYQIQGLANKYTDFSAVAQQQGIDTSVRLYDHRSKMDKYTVEEMVRKGY